MKLDAGRLAIAVGATAAILWTICSALVASMSGTMMTMTGHMLHMDTETFAWHMTIGGFVFGLIAWTVCAALAGWLVGAIYNQVGSQV